MSTGVWSTLNPLVLGCFSSVDVQCLLLLNPLRFHERRAIPCPSMSTSHWSNPNPTVSNCTSSTDVHHCLTYSTESSVSNDPAQKFRSNNSGPKFLSQIHLSRRWDAFRQPSIFTRTFTSVGALSWLILQHPSVLDPLWFLRCLVVPRSWMATGTWSTLNPWCWAAFSSVDIHWYLIHSEATGVE